MKINVKCNFCGSTFDEVGNNGICPACGARNNKKVKMTVRSREEEQEQIKKETKKRKKEKASAILSYFLVIFVVIGGYMLLEMFLMNF